MATVNFLEFLMDLNWGPAESRISLHIFIVYVTNLYKSGEKGLVLFQLRKNMDIKQLFKDVVMFF